MKNILFDLDGTLLPMDLDEFTHGYFRLLAAKLAPHRRIVEAPAAEYFLVYSVLQLL